MARGKQLTIGYFSEVWTPYASAHRAGVLKYVAAHPSVTLRDMRYVARQTHLDGAPPWHGLVDGVITSEGVERSPKETADWMLRGGVPVINLGADLIDPRVPIVHTSHASIGRLAAEHFLAMGLRNFAAIGFALAQASAPRREAFAAALRPHRLAPFACDLRHRMVAAHDDQGAERNEKQLVKLLSTAPKPLGVLAISDGVGLAVCRLAISLGFQIPHDVAVLGVGNSEPCWTNSPSLSSISTPGEEIGFTAAHTLHHILRGRPAPTRPIQIDAIEVVSRESTLVVGPRDAELTRAIEFIRRHACDPLDVEQVMQTITMSRRLFEQLFAEKVGTSPRQHIQQIRFDRACQLLKESTLSVRRIAEMIGFGTTAAFSKFFRQWSNQSPVQFRDQSGGATRSRTKTTPRT